MQTLTQHFGDCMRPTLRELAKMCGCSVPSASRALKDDPNISDELKAKVHKAAKEIGYIPDSIATSMRTGQTKTIAIILQDLMNPYFSIMANKMERCASDRGMDSIIITTDYSSRRELKAVHTALGKNVDGVLFLPVQKNTEALEALTKYGAPFVLVHRFFEGIFADCVRTDDRMGAYLVVRHLIEKGHRRILFINSFDYISSSRLREEGFKQAMREAGLRVGKKDMYRISTDKGACERLVRERFSGKHEHTAVFCYCDVVAYEAYYTLMELGRSVPGEVAVAGVDDLNSYITMPVRITSAGYDMQAMAEQSVDLLLEKINHKRRRNGGGPPWQERLLVLSQHLSVGSTT